MRLKAQIAVATLKSPIDGIVTEVNVTAGFDAPSGAAIVVDSTTLQITTDVVESDLADIKVGQEAAVSVSAIDANLTGTVSAISPVASSDSNSGVVSYPVTITLANAPATARAGMSADVTVTVPERHERPDRAGRGVAWLDGRLQRDGPRRGRAAAGQGGRRRTGHEHHGRDQERPHRG